MHKPLDTRVSQKEARPLREVPAQGVALPFDRRGHLPQGSGG
ncbi:MAG: hypothetical protein R3E54_04985 [Halioglobus sp.]